MPGRAARAEEFTVHHVLDPLRQVGEDLVALLLGEPPGLDGGGDVLLRRVDHRLDEAVDGLALGTGNLGERVAALEPLAQLVAGQTEVGRGSFEASEVNLVVVAGAVVEERPAEERGALGLEMLLERVRLLLREVAVCDGRVDPGLVRIDEG